jgi:hypothetical protein
MYIDGELADTFKMPTNRIRRRNELAWKFQLDEGKHHVKIKIINPKNGYWIDAYDLVTYSLSHSKYRHRP